MVALIVFALAGLLLLAVILEGMRQQRKLGEGGGRGTAMMRTGLLELQGFLEPERRVEMIQEQDDREALLVRLQHEGDKGDGRPD